MRLRNCKIPSVCAAANSFFFLSLVLSDLHHCIHAVSLALPIFLWLCCEDNAALNTWLNHSSLSSGFCSHDEEEHTSVLSAMTNLTCLKLSKNAFSDAPASLSKLTALQCFHFAANMLDSTDTLSRVLGNMTGLTKLILQHCNMEAIPDSLADLSELQWLCLSRNNLSRLPKKMPWGKLQVLHLRGNEFRAVPCIQLRAARQLVHVDCGDNFPLQVNAETSHCTNDTICTCLMF